MTLPGRRRIVALAVLLASIAGVLALLLITDESAPASSGLSSARPVRATTALLPSAVLFGDTVTARVHLVTDTSFVDPTSIRVSGSFAPYREISTPVLERRRVGSTEEIVWTTKLRCLGGPCVPRKQGKRVSFAPASVSYSIGQGSEAAARSLSVAWPSLLVYSRVDQVEVAARDPRDEPPWKGDYRSLPPVSYRETPGLVAALFLGGGGLLIAAAVALLAPVVRRRPEEVVEEPPALLVVWLTPLEQALVLLEREPAGEGEVEPRRQALELVSEALAERGERDLERAARRLAWSEAPPPHEETLALAYEVRGLLEAEALSAAAAAEHEEEHAHGD